VSRKNTQIVPQGNVNVLLISPFEKDSSDLCEILGQSGWQQHDARTKREALEFLRDNPTPIVICESELADGTWKDVLSEIAALESPPALVVTSRLADDALWAEVLHLGGFNVLSKPLDTKEVMHVVSYGGMLWKRQWELPQNFAQSRASHASRA
jgi:DNA-binding response OmpR family regulator